MGHSTAALRHCAGWLLPALSLALALGSAGQSAQVQSAAEPGNMVATVLPSVTQTDRRALMASYHPNASNEIFVRYDGAFARDLQADAISAGAGSCAGERGCGSLSAPFSLRQIDETQKIFHKLFPVPPGA